MFIVFILYCVNILYDHYTIMIIYSIFIININEKTPMNLILLVVLTLKFYTWGAVRLRLNGKIRFEDIFPAENRTD